jgi:hypothetical protein
VHQTDIGRFLLSVIKNTSFTIPIRFLGDVRLEYSLQASSHLMEESAVIRFFQLKKLSPKDIRAELDDVYGHKTLSLSPVQKWRKRVANGRVNLEDGPKSGTPRKAISANPGEPLSRKLFLFHARACVRSFASQRQFACASCATIFGSKSAISGPFRIQ